MITSPQKLFPLFTNAYAVIWDMDGVLIDSETHHFAAHKQALSEFGVPLSEPFYIRYGLGIDVQKFYNLAFKDARVVFDDTLFLKVHYRKLELYQKLQREKGIKLVQPAFSIVKKLYNNGVLMAIASQVDRDEVVRNLRGTSLLEYFPVIVSGGDFGLAKKPAPDIYQKAVEILNVKPESCIAVEDSPTGAQSALAAHIPCLVVTNHFTKKLSFPKGVISTTFPDIARAI